MNGLFPLRITVSPQLPKRPGFYPISAPAQTLQQNPARRFFRKALKQAHTVNPRTLTVDKNAAFPSATKAMKKSGELWRFTKLRQVKYLNNIVEQDHRRIKRLVRPGLGFKSFHTARRTIAGYEVMAMVRKGQVAAMPANDMSAQAVFVAALFRVAA